jgi:hypothetical protein
VLSRLGQPLIGKEGLRCDGQKRACGPGQPLIGKEGLSYTKSRQRGFAVHQTHDRQKGLARHEFSLLLMTWKSGVCITQTDKSAIA